MAEERTYEDAPTIVAMAQQFFREARDHSSNWRSSAETWYDMESGEQWDQQDLIRLQDEQRPAVVFNRILRTINAVIGSQVANRQETRYIPRETGDAAVNEVLTAAAEWVRDNCDAEDEESDAFHDMCVTGMGWTETGLSYDEDPDGDITITRIDPLEMYWDPGARKKNLSDARWVMHVKTMSISEFQESWPDVEIDVAGAPWESAEDDVSRRVHVYPQDAYEEGQRQAGNKKTVRVAHVQWAERVEAYRVGKKAEKVSGKAFERLRGKLEERNIRYIRQQEVKWRRAFVAGGAILEEGDCPYPHGPTLRCMTYSRDRNRGTWYGLVKSMMDPQRFGNKFFSQILDILNKGAKGGILAEADAVEDFRELESKWARPDAVLKLRPGGMQKIKQRETVNLPPALDRMMLFSLDNIHEVTGLNLELLGFANREQPGVLEAQRKQAGLTIIAPLFDAMKRYRKEQGRVMLHMIQNYIADGRLIRIVSGDGKERYVPLAKQPETAKYDVIVDEAPTSPNVKERVYGALVEMLPALGKMGAPMPPELLDYAPIPASLAEKWKELIRSAPGNDPKETQKLIEEGQRKIQQLTEENRKLKDKREEAIANLQLKAQEQQAELALKQEEMERESQLKREEMEREFQLKVEELRIKSQLDSEGVRQNMDLKRQEMGMKHQIESTNLTLDHEPAVAALAGMLGKIAERLEQQHAEIAALSAPKTIDIRRDKDGLMQTATVTPNVH